METLRVLLALAFKEEWQSCVEKDRIGGQRASSGADTVFKRT